MKIFIVAVRFPQENRTELYSFPKKKNSISFCKKLNKLGLQWAIVTDIIKPTKDSKK